MSGSRNRGNDQFHIPPAMRRHQQQQQMMMMQREREIMFLQFQHQQQQQQQQQVHLLMMMRHYEEQQRQRRLVQHQFQKLQMDLSMEIQVQPVDVERISEVESSLLVNSSMIRTNIDRLVEAVTPCVPVHHLAQIRRNGQEACEAKPIQFFNLDDLWESYREWSAYGAGVELKLNGNGTVTQYFVPSLSIIQLYVDPGTARPGIDAISQKMNKTSIPSSSTVENSQSRGKLVFEYQENEPPHQRKPFFDKISSLATGFSDLMKYRSCDLFTYQLDLRCLVPDLQNTYRTYLKNIRSIFSNFPSFIDTNKGNKSAMEVSKSSKTVLPVFGLATYKFKSPILPPLLEYEQRLSDSLFESAKKWIEYLNVYHPDFNFFIRNGKSSDTDTDQAQKA